MTTQTDPTRKLYKRCKRGNHAICDGQSAYASGLVYSVCECACHALTEHDTDAAVEAAQAIVTAPAKRTRKAKTTATPPEMTEGEARATIRKFAAKRAKAAAAFKPEPDGTYVNHPARYEAADWGLRGVKGKHAYGFFDPCDEHAIEENAIIIAHGRSESGAHKNIAANAIESCLRRCEACRERTRLKLSAWARTQGDVAQPIAYNPPKPYKKTRMSREAFIAKYDVVGGFHFAGTYEKGNVQTAAINRCANRECVVMHNGLVVLHDTTELCGSCVLAGVKPKRRK